MVYPNQTSGSCHVKQFRSPAEFAPHAAWLLSDPDLDPSNCGCKYCNNGVGRSRKPRSKYDRSDTPTTVTSLSSHHTRRSAPSTPTRRLTKSLSSGLLKRPSRGIRRQLSLRKIPSQRESSEEVTIPSQLLDLAALSHGRLYRNQELVWLVLDKPLSVSPNSLSDKDHTFHFWPGVIKSVVSPTVDQRAGGPKARYLVALISIGRSYFVPQKSIIPLRAYIPDENALADLQSLGTSMSPDGFGNDFDPLPQFSTPETFPQGSALGRSPLEELITGIEMAKHIATTWTATDGYYLTGQQPKGLDTTVASSSRADASHTGFLPLRRSTEGENRRRYGGLWWGAERIWAGDLLILSFPESSIKYSSEDSSCFARDARDEDPTSNLQPEDRKPEEKCVFLKLRALETVRTEQGFTALEATGNVYRLTPVLSSVQAKEPSSGDLGLPRPPDGFVFRPVLSPGIETQLPLQLIRGRYYPQLLSSLDKELESVEGGLKAMGGLGPAGFAAWKPRKHIVESRRAMLNMDSRFDE